MKLNPPPTNIDPLKLRAVRCPKCATVRLVKAELLSQVVSCSCEHAFVGAENQVSSDYTPDSNPYAVWQCPKCKRNLLVPALAIYIPARCSCGTAYPLKSDTVSQWVLDSIETCILGNDPMFFDNMLRSYRAAQKYNYDVEQADSSCYRVTNPSNGRRYLVTLSDPGNDICECDTFAQGGDTCIHIEYVRKQLGLPSPSQQFANTQRFAYAWFDKSCLPARIRIGWTGPVETEVKQLLTGIMPPSNLESLEQIRTRFEDAGIPFLVLLSARFALSIEQGLLSDSSVTEAVDLHGRKFLAKRIPVLRQYQVEGAMFLASAQRALLLDEMGLGKTIQAIAAACLLKKFAGLRNCLIVTPKSVVRQWVTELDRFVNEECIVIEGSADRRYDLYQSDIHFKVVTLESFRNDYPRVGNPELVIFDEVHKVRNSNSVANRVFRDLKTRFFFGLSGTAIEKGLDDLFGIIRAARFPNIESLLAFSASHIVCNAFGGKAFTIHPEFFYIRHTSRILRRLKSEVERGLPPLQVQEEQLDLTPLQNKLATPLLEEANELRERLKQRYDAQEFERQRWLVNRIVELSDSSALLEPTTSSSSKLEWLGRFLKEKCLVESEKVVVFTRWVRMQTLICALCESLGIRFESLSGQDSGAQREEAIAAFASNREVRAFISTDAGGVGVNLQMARIVVNFEPAWNPSTNAQRIQRVHRIGQTREVIAVHLLTMLDEFFVRTTYRRKMYSSEQIDMARDGVDSVEVPTWGELNGVIEAFRNWTNRPLDNPLVSPEKRSAKKRVQKPAQNKR